ncbi:MAG: hypothetical protein R6T83_00855 [Salinibacter sp.]
MHSLRRALVLVLATLLSIPLSAVAQLPANALEGTWRMVSQERVYPDSVVELSDRWGPSYKILNSTHFAWGRETEDGETVLAGGGRYEYHPERNVYIEHIQYHSDPGFSGTTLQFDIRVEGDTWYHTGDVGDYELREVWRRVDPDKVRRQLAGKDTTGVPALDQRITDEDSP